MGAKRFTVELQRVQKTGTMFRIPFDLEEAFGRARPPVKVTIRGHTWRTTPGVYDGVGYIVVNREVKAATGVDAPERVRVSMELDTEPRTVRVPADLRAALDADEMARKGFAKLSYSHRRDYVEWVERGQAARDEDAPYRRDRRARPRRASSTLMARLAGAIAAASTPLRDHGGRLDDDAFGPYADFLVGAGLDGVLAFGTNGEAVLLSTDERRRGLERWLEAVDGRTLVAAHCGAQTTDDTVSLAAHAAEAARTPSPSSALRTSSSTRRPSEHTCSPLRRRAPHCRSTSTSSRRPPATPSTRRCSHDSGRRPTTSWG